MIARSPSRQEPSKVGLTNDDPLDTTVTALGVRGTLHRTVHVRREVRPPGVHSANRAIAQFPTKGLVTDHVTTEMSTITHKGYFRRV
jgi:hypothetical protein